LDGGLQDLAYFGIPTFCKFPHTRDPRGADVAVVGVPQDQTVLNRPGARYGPRAIRLASQLYGSEYDADLGFYDIELGRHILEGTRLIDYGDVAILPTLTDLNMQAVTRAISEILDGGALPLTLGGDHSIVFPVVRAFEGERLDVVHFDTHLDFTDDYADLGLKFSHGNPIKRISELENVDRITQVGARGLTTPRSVHEEALRAGSSIITASDAIAKGHEWVLEKVPAAENVYVTVDIDVLDPAVAPGTGTPEPGGLSYRLLADILAGLPDKGRVVGFDIVEVNPLYDTSELTSHVAARLALDFLGAIFAAR